MTTNESAPDPTAGDMSLADVSALVGDDIDYWLGNPFMTPGMIAAKVRWWVADAATKARADERERIAQAIEAKAEGLYPHARRDFADAARIARDGGR